MWRGAYHGPRNQLRGERALVRQVDAPKGFVKVQFDRLDLTVAGVYMASGWHLIREQYMRPAGGPSWDVISLPPGLPWDERRDLTRRALRGQG